MKEVIYTTIFIILGIVLIFLLVYMFGHPGIIKQTPGSPGTKPVYTRLPFSLRDRIWMFR